jgi:hypothetical protein
MYKSASRFINSDRFAAFVGTCLEVKGRPGSASPKPWRRKGPPRRKGKMTIEEREQLGHGKPDQEQFLARVQQAISSMVKAGVRNPKRQARRLNVMGIPPYSGGWSARLVVMFFQRQHERHNAQAGPESLHQQRDVRAAVEATKGAIGRSKTTASNPVLSTNLGAALLARFGSSVANRK